MIPLSLEVNCNLSATAHFTRILAMIAVTLFATNSSAAIIVNGDFETGTLAGWTVDPGPVGDAIGYAW